MGKHTTVVLGFPCSTLVMKTRTRMSIVLAGLAGFLYSTCTPAGQYGQSKGPDHHLLFLSEELLLSVRTESPTDSLEAVFAGMSFAELRDGLSDDKARNVFWINLYNAWYQILALRDDVDKDNIFTAKLIPVAGETFSLDAIEHGILRRHRWKYGLGFLPRPFTPRAVRQLSVQQLDYRIHFALNCGARSCPPIAFYSYDSIDEQLDLAARAFLSSETEIDDAAREVHTSRILQWFIGDFGGKRGVREVLAKYLDRDLQGFAIHYKEYDWGEDLMNFVSEDDPTK